MPFGLSFFAGSTGNTRDHRGRASNTMRYHYCSLSDRVETQGIHSLEPWRGTVHCWLAERLGGADGIEIRTDAPGRAGVQADAQHRIGSLDHFELAAGAEPIHDKSTDSRCCRDAAKIDRNRRTILTNFDVSAEAVDLRCMVRRPDLATTAERGGGSGRGVGVLHGGRERLGALLRRRRVHPHDLPAVAVEVEEAA